MAIDTLFVGNIPGNSLTVEPGSVPWEQPPKYVTLEETAEYYANYFTNPEIIYGVLEALKRKTPILTLVNPLIKVAIMKGLHTVHVGFLVTPIIVEIIKTLAEINDIDYVTTIEEKVTRGKPDPRAIKELIKEIRAELKENPETKLEEPVEAEPVKRGLMAREA